MVIKLMKENEKLIIDESRYNLISDKLKIEMEKEYTNAMDILVSFI